jgi:ABC-type multidrug transport system ATPase subunit
MISIQIEQLSKRFNHGWLFRDLNFEAGLGDCVAITGPNGSGKSTLIKLLAGFNLPSAGEIRLFENNQSVNANEWYKYITIVAPYQDLIEEFNPEELLAFHFQFKPKLTDSNIRELMQTSGLPVDVKALKYYSSGMKQRIKLLMAFYGNSPIILLDEPTSFLDSQGIAWFEAELDKAISAKRLIFIASNEPREIEKTNKNLKINHHNKISVKEF